jgi:flagellar biosynthesis/type III secretory pathway chaperone
MCATSWQKTGRSPEKLIALTAIETLLEHTVADLKRFIAAIAAERSTLISGDIDQLPAIAGEKSALATRIASLETQRDAALGAAGFGAGRKGIDAWLASIPAPASRSPRNVWKVYLDLAVEAKRENEINGKLIAAGLQQNQQALAALLGEEADAGTYGADGQRKTGSGRRPLGCA